jgi:hypothetical protein
MASKLFEKFTLTDAQRFVIDTSRNPLTGRSIKMGGQTYNKLIALAYKLLPDNDRLRSMLKKHPHDSVKTCRKWVKACDAAGDYGCSHRILCKCGAWRDLFLIHDECGDYLCSYCDKDVTLMYYCFVCKHASEDDMV